MHLIDHDRVTDLLDWRRLIEALRENLAKDRIEAPARQVHEIRAADGQSGHLLIMPAWEAGRGIGVKIVTFFPQNAGAGLPSINAGYLLFDGQNGTAQATIDGDALTARRTAAASALAADYLARQDARHLTIVGTGQLAQSVAQAHCTLRDYDKITIWGRAPAKAEKIAECLREDGLPAYAVADLEAACRAADVISTVTASNAPLVQGAWLQEGSHLDLIGAFKHDMRESDTQAIIQARVFVDTEQGAVLAGDLAQPMDEGAFDPATICGDLAALIRSDIEGRRNDTERTVFKSVGMASEDLIAAQLIADTAT